jgi:diguanylate cyclase (GGDEF)-like protein
MAFAAIVLPRASRRGRRKEALDYRWTLTAGKAKAVRWRTKCSVKGCTDVTKTQPKSASGAGAAALLAEIERLNNELLRAEWRIAELEARADVDPLTDIFNRRGFDRELKRSLAYIARYGTDAALVFLDLDGFKGVNDRHGHAAGDALLKAVAREITGRVRASDVVARLGGDEFAVLLWHVNAAQALAKARDLETVIAAAGIGEGAARISAGASAGIASLGRDMSPSQATDAADAAMYARKKERRG